MDLTEVQEEAILQPSVIGGRIRTTAHSRRQRAEFEELLTMRAEDAAGREQNKHWREQWELKQLAARRAMLKGDRLIMVRETPLMYIEVSQRPCGFNGSSNGYINGSYQRHQLASGLHNTNLPIHSSHTLLPYTLLSYTPPIHTPPIHTPPIPQY
jgi:hypothetical protein